MSATSKLEPAAPPTRAHVSERDRAQQHRVRARRRTVMLVGSLVLLLAPEAACIFERSNYQGGGRQDQGAAGQTAEPTSSTEPTATEPTPTTSSTQDSATNPVVDAGLSD